MRRSLYSTSSTVSVSCLAWYYRGSSLTCLISAGTGDIVFWETLSTHSKKQAKVYRKDNSDPFCRLRVPLYLKVLEVVFFAAFLGFYYAVLVQRPIDHITAPEVMLYIWLVSFGYNGISPQ